MRPKVVIPSESVTLLRLLQLAKTSSPSSVTLSGMLMLCMLLQASNARLPILVTPLLTTTLLTEDARLCQGAGLL